MDLKLVFREEFKEDAFFELWSENVPLCPTEYLYPRIVDGNTVYELNITNSRLFFQGFLLNSLARERVEKKFNLRIEQNGSTQMAIRIHTNIGEPALFIGLKTFSYDEGVLVDFYEYNHDQPNPPIIYTMYVPIQMAIEWSEKIKNL